MPELDMLRFNMWNSAFMLSQHAAVYPADVVKTRVQIGQSARSETAAMLKQARAIVAESGAGGLYRGFGWAAAPLAAQEALYYSTYSYTKRLLVDAGARDSGDVPRGRRLHVLVCPRLLLRARPAPSKHGC